MNLRTFLPAALLLFSNPLAADQQDIVQTAQPAASNSAAKVDAIADPAASTGESKQEPPAKPEPVNRDGLQDPTRMNENFRSALEHSGRASSPSGSGADTRASLPNISLVASVCGRHKDKASAMLRINDKTEIVHAGDKISHIEKNQLIEIHVLELHKRHVRLKIFPSNENIILR